MREIIYTKEKEEKIDQQKDNFVLNPDRVFQRLGVLSVTMNYCSNWFHHIQNISRRNTVYKKGLYCFHKITTEWIISMMISTFLSIILQENSDMNGSFFKKEIMFSDMIKRLDHKYDMTFSLFESAPDRKDCFIQFWIYFIYGILKKVN